MPDVPRNPTSRSCVIACNFDPEVTGFRQLQKAGKDVVAVVGNCPTSFFDTVILRHYREAVFEGKIIRMERVGVNKVKQDICEYAALTGMTADQLLTKLKTKLVNHKKITFITLKEVPSKLGRLECELRGGPIAYITNVAFEI